MSAAAELFYRRGYHNVGTGDIAAAVGITAGALYRHFSNKQELLEHTLSDVFTESTIEVSAREVVDLDAIVDRLATRAAERRDLGVLWNRESRHLAPDRLHALRGDFFTFVDAFREALRRARPELPEADAELLTWCALGALTSSSYHRTDSPEAPLAELLRRMAIVILTCRLPEPDPAQSAAAAPTGLLHHGRRESILVAATRLFDARGYWAVTVDEIGAEVGISGAAVYKHFESKVDILSAVIARASEPLQLGLTNALSSARTPEEGLVNALRAYVDFALTHHDLVGILVSEVPNLPDRQRHAVRRAQHDYVTEWIRLLRDARPELDQQTATFLVHGTLTVINDASRTAHLRERPDLGVVLRLIGHRIVHLPL